LLKLSWSIAERVTRVQDHHTVDYSNSINSAVDCSILLKFGTVSSLYRRYIRNDQGQRSKI